MLRRLAFAHHGLSTAAVAALRLPTAGSRCWSSTPASSPSFRAAAGLAASRVPAGRGRVAALPAGRPGLAALRMASATNGMDTAAAPAEASPTAKRLMIATHDGTFRTWPRRRRGCGGGWEWTGCGVHCTRSGYGRGSCFHRGLACHSDYWRPALAALRAHV